LAASAKVPDFGDDQRELLALRDQLAHRMGVDDGDEVGVERRRDPVLGGAVGIAQRADRFQDRRPACLWGTGGGALVQLCAGLADEVDVLAERDLDLGVVAPRPERVAPRLDTEGPPAHDVDVELRRPAVGPADVGQLAHAVERQRCAVGPGDDDVRRDHVVALAEDRGAHRHGLADGGLGRPARAVDDRPDIGNRDTSDHRARTYPSHHEVNARLSTR